MNLLELVYEHLKSTDQSPISVGNNLESPLQLMLYHQKECLILTLKGTTLKLSKQIQYVRDTPFGFASIDLADPDALPKLDELLNNWRRT